MYCVQCGVKLADTEQKCPLCQTVVYHPDILRAAAQPLYPVAKMPQKGSGAKALSGAVLFLFMLPLLIGLFSDLNANGQLDWFGYMAGGVVLGYVILALPLWFRKPNPVIFVPCDFAATSLYLLLIALMTGGGWYLSFALPVTVCAGMIVTAVITLLRYIRKGRLYIFGGGFVAIGAHLLMTELLLGVTFGISFVGWSIYPLIALSILGILLIFLAINSNAREKMERKFFF